MSTQEDVQYWTERRRLLRLSILRMSETLETLEGSEDDRSETMRRLSELRSDEQYVEQRLEMAKAGGMFMRARPVDC